LRLVLPGEVEGVRDAQLASTLGGYVERVLARQGDAVAKGQPIAWINKGVQDANLSQAKAQMDLARAEMDRTTQAGASVSRARRDSARLQHQSAEAAHRLASIYAASAVVRAPFPGVIADLHVEEGEVAAPGGRVARLVQLDPVLVRLTVSDRDVVNLEPGQPVTVETDARAQVFTGVLKRVTPAADVSTRAFSVEVEVANGDGRLLPGMIARVRIAVEKESEALTIPQHVLVTRKDTNGVFVVESGRAVWREVELGPVIRDQVVVTSGIEPGQVVVVTGHRELAHMDPVIVSRSGVCCTDGRVDYSAPVESASAR
jgi:membrane fusion protein (multidrug efflux system)